jgi:chromosome segregation ATPase
MILGRWKIATLILFAAQITAAGAGVNVACEDEKDPSKVVAPGRESRLERQNTKLEAYSQELTIRIKARESEWIQMAQQAIRDPAVQQAKPDSVLFDEYRRARDQLFANGLRLIGIEALYEDRQAAIEARSPEADRETATLLKEIKQLERKFEASADLRPLIAKWKAELAGLLVKQGQEDAELHELTAQIAALKAKMNSYETAMSKLRAEIEQKAAQTLKLSVLREDLATLREMRSSVDRQIEQLKFDARAPQQR